MFFIINSSFQQGFTSYLEQKEIRQANAMAPFLSTFYHQQDSWQKMHRNHRLWEQALLSADISPPPKPLGGRPPPRRANDISHQDSPKPLRDNTTVDNHPPLHNESAATEPFFALRISLYDKNKKIVFGSKQQIDNSHWLPINVDQQVIGWLYLRSNNLAGNLLAKNFIEQQQQSFIYIAIAVIFFSTLLASVWAIFLQRPINKVIVAVKQLATGQHNSRVKVSGSDEFTQLAINFNQMAQALEQNKILRAQWIADISHELRTPVSVIRGEIEALIDGIRQPTPERINSLYEETTALAQLIDDLHLLSLADNQALNLKREYCEPHYLITHQIGLFDLRMQKKGLSLSLDNKITSDVKMYVDSRRMSQVFNNLLENSLRYTDSGGQVKVMIYLENQHIVFSICDSTPGVCDEGLTKIFDRLYCADKSRSRSAGGSGLGLSICKSIIDAHQGNIFAQHNNDNGLCIKVQLPCVHQVSL
jgi:two-component system sensor histidine kinase BaeS